MPRPHGLRRPGTKRALRGGSHPTTATENCVCFKLPFGIASRATKTRKSNVGTISAKSRRRPDMAFIERIGASFEPRGVAHGIAATYGVAAGRCCPTRPRRYPSPLQSFAPFSPRPCLWSALGGTAPEVAPRRRTHSRPHLSAPGGLLYWRGQQSRRPGRQEESPRVAVKSGPVLTTTALLTTHPVSKRLPIRDQVPRGVLEDRHDTEARIHPITLCNSDICSPELRLSKIGQNGRI